MVVALVSGSVPGLGQTEPGGEEAAPTARPTRELRLGLVCYGGVSLAIYIHGVTKEINNLVIASDAFERARRERPMKGMEVENPYDKDQTPVLHAYFEALEEAEDDPNGRTRVVVDAISGTSAGGINGIFLAKALAYNLSQQGLRQLWMDRGDINELVGGWAKKYLKILGLAGSLLTPGWKTEEPLRGDLMMLWLLEALEQMDASAGDRPHGEPSTLVPSGQPLELFVTMTDHYGYQRAIPVTDPRGTLENRHRHRMHFRHIRKDDGEFLSADFGVEWNEALAFAARATSSFQGAFPPVNLEEDLQAARGASYDVSHIERRFFREYRLAGRDAKNTYFVDGGTIDNYPFGHVIDALTARQAETEVDRRLLYIHPDPRKSLARPAPGEREEPSWIGAVAGGLSSIPGFEPIVDEVVEVEERNQRIKLIDGLVKRQRKALDDDLKKLLLGVPDDPSEAELEQLRAAINEQVEKQAGFGYESYRLTRINSVLRTFGLGIAKRLGFPTDSVEALYVADVIREWAQFRRLIGGKADVEGQKRFLELFDVGFTRRRIKFVDHVLNRMYPKADSGKGRPTRADLDGAKRMLGKQLVEIIAVIRAETVPLAIQTRIGQVFAPARISERAKAPDGSPEAFARRNLEQLNEIEELLADHIAGELSATRMRLYGDFREATREWDRGNRNRVLLYYLGFPLWDLLIYPFEHLGNLGEFDPVEVVRISPEESDLLEPGGTEAKLQGIGVAHFQAFFKRRYRENDYLWGRLDAVERLMKLVWPKAETAALHTALRGVLDEERELVQTKQVRETIDRLAAKLDQAQ